MIFPDTNSPIFVGICGLRLPDKPPSFPRGMTLRKTSARIETPLMLKGDGTLDGNIMPAWYKLDENQGFDITTEAYIPAGAGNDFHERVSLVRTLIFMLRVWIDPSIIAPVICSRSFGDRDEEGHPTTSIMRYETKHRWYRLKAEDVSEESISQNLTWIAAEYDTCHRLATENKEFQIASNALDSGQFIEHHALILISLWGGLEALFSPSTTELRFRVSALISAYLAEPGHERAKLHKEIIRLYDERSKAAHGRLTQDTDVLLATFILVRSVITKIIREKRTPSKLELEEKLFGC